MITKRLFDLDSYIKENKAKVLSCKASNRKDYEGLYEVIFDTTIFSPEGGGQSADRGFVDDIEVKDVQEMDGELIHFLTEAIEENKEVNQTIDFELRFRRMQNHNAEHLLCGLIHEKFGYSNVGFHISESRMEDGRIAIETTMDVDGAITQEEINEIELKANKAIAENVSIYAMLPTKEEAAAINYRSKLDIDEGLRLVVIEGYDICACCAPCLKSSAEIQMVKVLSMMPHRGGTRFTITAGYDAIEDYMTLHMQTKEIMKMLSSKRYDCAQAVALQSQKMQEEHEMVVSLKKEITGLYQKSLENLLENSKSKYVVFFGDSLDEIQARSLINEAVSEKEIVLAVMFAKGASGYRFVVGKNDKLTDVSLRTLAGNMREKLSARGGGSEQMIQGSVEFSESLIKEFFEMQE